MCASRVFFFFFFVLSCRLIVCLLALAFLKEEMARCAIRLTLIFLDFPPPVFPPCQLAIRFLRILFFPSFFGPEILSSPILSLSLSLSLS